MYTIYKIPSLRVLDFVKIKDEERERAKRLAKSAAGAVLEGDAQTEAREAAAKTFTPGEGQSTKDAFITNFTPEQKMMIKQMIADAKNPTDIEYIKNCVTRGEFPSSLSHPTSTSSEPLLPPPPTAMPTNEKENGVVILLSGKRKASEINGDSAAEVSEKYKKMDGNS